LLKLALCCCCHSFAEGGEEEGERKPKVTIREAGAEGNVVDKLTTATSSVVGKMGNIAGNVGKGLGGFTSKLGGGSWF